MSFQSHYYLTTQGRFPWCDESLPRLIDDKTAQTFDFHVQCFIMAKVRLLESDAEALSINRDHKMPLSSTSFYKRVLDQPIVCYRYCITNKGFFSCDPYQIGLKIETDDDSQIRFINFSLGHSTKIMVKAVWVCRQNPTLHRILKRAFGKTRSLSAPYFPFHCALNEHRVSIR